MVPEHCLSQDRLHPVNRSLALELCFGGNGQKKAARETQVTWTKLLAENPLLWRARITLWTIIIVQKEVKKPGNHHRAEGLVLTLQSLEEAVIIEQVAKYVQILPAKLLGRIHWASRFIAVSRNGIRHYNSYVLVFCLGLHVLLLWKHFDEKMSWERSKTTNWLFEPLLALNADMNANVCSYDTS